MRRWIIAVVVAGALIGGGVVWADQSGGASATKYLTAAVTRGTVADTIAATGSVTPAQTLSLSFGGSTAGGSGGGPAGTDSSTATEVESSAPTVTTVAVHVGEHVAAGVTLAKVDDTSQQADLSTAQAQLDAAEAAESSEDSGTSASQVSSDAAAVATAQQQVDAAQAEVDATVLKAPVGGVVTAVNVSKGLPPPSSTAIGMRSSSLVVTASVAEDDVPALQAGQRATLTFPALSTNRTGVLTALPTQAASSSSDSASISGSGGAVTYPVTIAIRRPPTNLLPGMSAQISIVVTSHPDVLRVPTSAIQGSADAPTVRVMVAGKPVTRRVQVGLSTNSYTEVTSGLTLGETVVTGVVNPTSSTTQTPGGNFGGGGTFGGGGGNVRQFVFRGGGGG